ncbi:heavy metal translocating P-type ATPase [Cohnella soli]|uniref:P-type Cu(+) transporter n=1 Tax=Cohnella soli TaxID=425005 RepID=A0ABW0HY03_9BACL
MNKVELQITGMTCAACSARIEKVLGRMDGVEEATVSLATATAVVQWQHRPALDADAIMDKIRGLGYGAERRRRENNVFLAESADWRRRFLISLAVSAPLFLAMAAHALVPLGVVAPAFLMNGYLQWGLGSLLVLYVGYPFYANAYRALKSGMPNMDVLVALSVTAAYLYSQYMTFRHDAAHMNHEDHNIAAHPDLSFDSIAMVLTAVTFGKWLEAIAKGNALRSLTSLHGLQVASASLFAPNGEKLLVPSASLRVGDVIAVQGGETIAADAVVVEGMAEVDESLLTGETRLALKIAGERLFAGTRLASGQLVGRVTSAVNETLLARMISYVEEAQQLKPRIQRKVDIVAAYFVPAILVVAAASFAAWSSLATTQQAFTAAIAVLLVACPCALGLATPVSMLIGVSRAAKAGIVFKEGGMLEALGRTDAIVFDKTGTLTVGRPVVTAVHSETLSEAKLIRLAASVEARSEHPFARALLEEAAIRKIALAAPSATEEIAGRGIRGVVEGWRIILGHAGWFTELGIAVPECSRITDEREEEHSRLEVALNGRWVGSVSFGDTLREDAAATVALLAKEAELWLATGDGEGAALPIAAEAGIVNVKARLLPEQKLELVRSLQQGGRSVAMIGDGANDSAALAAANVGLTMAGGNAAALQAGDVILLGGRFAAVRDAYGIAKATMRNIRQNLGIALLYNVVMVPLAAFGQLNPRIACLCMASSSLLVVANALRLRNVPIGGGQA